MRSQQEAGSRWVAALPGIKQAAPSNFLVLQLRMNAREAAFEEGMQSGNGFGRRVRLLCRNGLNLQRLRKPLNGGGVYR